MNEDQVGGPGALKPITPGTSLGSFAKELPLDVQVQLGVPSAFPYLYLTIGIAIAAIIIAVVAIVMKRR